MSKAARQGTEGKPIRSSGDVNGLSWRPFAESAPAENEVPPPAQTEVEVSGWDD